MEGWETFTSVTRDPSKVFNLVVTTLVVVWVQGPTDWVTRRLVEYKLRVSLSVLRSLLQSYLCLPISGPFPTTPVFTPSPSFLFSFLSKGREPDPPLSSVRSKRQQNLSRFPSPDHTLRPDDSPRRVPPEETPVVKGSTDRSRWVEGI